MPGTMSLLGSCGADGPNAPCRLRSPSQGSRNGRVNRCASAYRIPSQASASAIRRTLTAGTRRRSYTDTPDPEAPDERNRRRYKPNVKALSRSGCIQVQVLPAEHHVERTVERQEYLQHVLLAPEERLNPSREPLARVLGRKVDVVDLVRSRPSAGAAGLPGTRIARRRPFLMTWLVSMNRKSPSSSQGEFLHRDVLGPVDRDQAGRFRADTAATNQRVGYGSMTVCSVRIPDLGLVELFVRLPWPGW